MEVVLVPRYMVVANQTLGSEPLFNQIRELARAGSSSFHLVVPITPPKDHVWTEGEARALAAERLDAALGRLGALGIEADGAVGDESPMLAIEDAIREEDGPFEAIVLSTLPRGLSRWLKLDLPHRVESAFGLRVLHVVAQAEDVGSNQT